MRRGVSGWGGGRKDENGRAGQGWVNATTWLAVGCPVQLAEQGSSTWSWRITNSKISVHGG